MPCFEGAGFGLLTSPRNSRCKDGLMVDSSFGYTIHMFIAKDAFMTWDPDEFNIKRIQGTKKAIHVTTE
jgi:hypothetical protein